MVAKTDNPNIREIEQKVKSHLALSEVKVILVIRAVSWILHLAFSFKDTRRSH